MDVYLKLFVFISVIDLFLASSPSDRIFWPDSLLGIVGGREAAPPPEDDPVAFALLDDHWAEVVGQREGQYPSSYYKFLGLRYAEPPVGRLRFQRPKRMPLFGRVSGLKYGAPCPQPDPDSDGKVTGSEDCLFLNIYTPKLPDSNPLLPVLLWIHGGGFRYGSASQYGGGYLAKRDVVVVTVQYRLGALGYLSTGESNLPGNAALFDIAAAISWLKTYIEFFGGDPSNIIPFGQGTGGSTAVLMALSNITHGRMGGVIAMSGSAISPFAIDDRPLLSTERIAQESGCSRQKTLDMIKCLQEAPVEHIINSETKVEKRRVADEGVVGVAASLTTAPVVEGVLDYRGLPPYLEETPEVALSNLNHIPAIPLLTGVTKHETAGVVTGRLKNSFLDSLKSIPNFLDQVLVKKLINVNRWTTQLKKTTENQLKTLKQLTGNYEQFRPQSLLDGLNQVIEVTTDAFFNFPAFKMSDEWIKKKIPTFFYSFEHNGKLKGSEKIYKGTLLATQDMLLEELKAVSHGSDLPYIFDLRSLHGTPDANFNESTRLSKEDQAVRDNFLNIITQFAKTKNIQIGKDSNMFPNFITIGPTPTLGKNFRECQMGLWSGIKMGKFCPTLDLKLNLSPNLNIDLLQRPNLGLDTLFNKTAGNLGEKAKIPGVNFPNLG